MHDVEGYTHEEIGGRSASSRARRKHSCFGRGPGCGANWRNSQGSGRHERRKIRRVPAARGAVVQRAAGAHVPRDELFAAITALAARNRQLYDAGRRTHRRRIRALRLDRHGRDARDRRGDRQVCLRQTGCRRAGGAHGERGRWRGYGSVRKHGQYEESIRKREQRTLHAGRSRPGAVPRRSATHRLRRGRHRTRAWTNSSRRGPAISSRTRACFSIRRPPTIPRGNACSRISSSCSYRWYNALPRPAPAKNGRISTGVLNAHKCSRGCARRFLRDAITDTH